MGLPYDDAPKRGGGLRWDMTIKLSHIVQFGGMIVIGSGLYFGITGSITELDRRVKTVEEVQKDFSEIQSQVRAAKATNDAQDETQKMLVEAIRRMTDRINTISTDTAAIRGRLEGQDDRQQRGRMP